MSSWGKNYILLWGVWALTMAQPALASQGRCSLFLGELFRTQASNSRVKVQSYGPRIELKTSTEIHSQGVYREEFTLLSYNLLNLETTKGKFTEDLESGNFLKLKDAKLKDPHHREVQAHIIRKIDPDISILQEVENFEALKGFNEDFLRSDYMPLLISGNDARGIDIGVLIRKNLNMDIAYQSFRDLKVHYQGKVTPVFTRDFPVIELRPSGSSPRAPPKLLIAGVHLKSKRSKKDDEGSIKLREKQVRAMLEIRAMYEAEYGKEIPMIMAGDYNNSMESGRVASEFKIFRDSGFRDAFDLVKAPKLGDCNCRSTHTYHTRDGETVKQQLDSFQMSEVISRNDAVKASGIVRYRDEAGREVPLPDSHEQRKKNPSDHYPIWVRLDLSRIFRF